MTERVSLAEYEYFRDERLSRDEIRAQGQYVLFLSLKKNEQHEIPPLRDPATDEGRPEVLFGKTACLVTSIDTKTFSDSPDICLEPNVAPGFTSSTGTLRMKLKGGILIASEHYTLSRALVLMYPLLVARYEYRESVHDFGLVLDNGFLTGEAHTDAPNLELVASSGHDDGSAPALVPSHPKSPLPAQYREAELPQ